MPSRRIEALRRFLAIKEAVMLTLVALSLGFLVLEHTETLTHAQLQVIELFEIGVALVFLAEFWFEWRHAKDRRQYVKHHWFYLLAAIPIPTQMFEILRGVRALRLLKLLKVFAHMRYERNTHLFEKRGFR